MPTRGSTPRLPPIAAGAKAWTADSHPIVAVEYLPPVRHFEKNLRGLEASWKPRIEILEALHHDPDTERIHVAKGTTPERRKADSEDGANVAIASGADDTLAQAARRFVQHCQNGALLNLDCGHLGARWSVAVCRSRNRLSNRYLPRRQEEAVHALIDVAFLAIAVVTVKPLLRLPPVTSGGNDCLNRFRGLHAIRECLRHDLSRLHRNVESHLVDQRDGPDRKTKLDERLVDDVDGNALVEQQTGLVDVRRQNPVGVESGTIVHDDHGFPELLAVANDRCGDLRVRLLSRDHLEQRHLVHGRKEMHPDHPLGPARCFGDVRDRDRARVRREYRRRVHRCFGLAKHLVLDGEILEHRLDYEIDVSEPRVVDGAAKEC